MAKIEPILLESREQLEEELRNLDMFLDEHKPHPLHPKVQPLFRGQSDATWPLSTTIERFLPQEELSVERYNIYMGKIHPAVESLTGKTWPYRQPPKYSTPYLFHPDNYEFMVYCRHHGFPSPLLDWTRSPYVALYFAFRDAVPERPVALYAYVKSVNGISTGWDGQPMIHELGPYVAAHERHFLQQSQFTVGVKNRDGFGYEYLPHEGLFGGQESKENLLRVYHLPSELRKPIMEWLDTVNINEHSLFRTVEALMQSLAVREILVGKPTIPTPPDDDSGESNQPLQRTSR